MADNTYQPLVYMKQGSTELVVASSGLVTVEDGGEVTVEDGGVIDMESGGNIAWPVSGATSSDSGSAAGAVFGNSGVSFITSSGDARKFEIAAPSVGCHKWFFCTAGTTGMVQYFSAGTGVAFLTTAGGSTGHMLIREGTTSNAYPAHVHLMGFSTSQWLVMDRNPTSSWIAAGTSS